MALKTYLVNGNQANYSDAEFSAIQTLMFNVGVFDSNGELGELKVLENNPANLSVDVDTGSILMRYLKNGVVWHVIVNNGTVANLTLAANNSGANRVDAIVIHLKQSEPNSLKNNVAEFRVITGTGIVSLTNGDIDTELGDSNWYRLADVTVANAAATVLQAGITDTRVRISFLNYYKRLHAQELYESASGQGVDINNTRFQDDYIDFEEIATPGDVPDSGRWFQYFKAGGLYIMDDVGNEVKVATGGISVEKKPQNDAAQGEVFESEEMDTLSFKDLEGGTVNLGFGGIYGENLTVGDPLTPYKVTNKGVVKYSPSADTYVDQFNTNANFQANTTLSTYGSGGSEKHALFKFDNLIADLGVTSIEIERIVSFNFNFYRTSAPVGSVHNLYPIKTAWNVGTVTYTTKPTFDNAALFSTPFNSTTGYIIFAVTNFISKEASDYILANGFAIAANHNTNGPHVWGALDNANEAIRPYIDNLVYIGVDGKLYKAKGLYPESVRDFVGLATKTDIVDSKHVVATEGMSVPASGLTPGATYYIDNDGVISQTPGTFMKEIGSAKGDDKFQIKNGPCYLGGRYNGADGSSIKVPRGANMAVCAVTSAQSGGFNHKDQMTLFKRGATSATAQSENNGVSLYVSASWDLANNEIDINILGGSGQGHLGVDFYQI